MYRSTLALGLVVLTLSVRAGTADDIIKKYEIDMSDWRMIDDSDSNVKCVDDHAGWSGDCAMLKDDWLKDTDAPGKEKQGRSIICHNLCCVIAHHKSGSDAMLIPEMAMWGNNANLHCNGPNGQTWIRGTEENYLSEGNGTWKMCMINKNSGNIC